MPARSFLINYAFSATSKPRTPNVYCWSRKTLVALHWTHLRVNLICFKSICHKKGITARCSLRDDFNGNVAIFNVYKWRHSDVIVIKLTAGSQNYIPYKMYTVSQKNPCDYVFDYNLSSKRPTNNFWYSYYLDYRSSKCTFTFPLHLFCATALPWEFVEPENS